MQRGGGHGSVGWWLLMRKLQSLLAWAADDPFAQDPRARAGPGCKPRAVEGGPLGGGLGRRWRSLGLGPGGGRGGRGQRVPRLLGEDGQDGPTPPCRPLSFPEQPGLVAPGQPPAHRDREGLCIKHSRLLNERVQIWQQSWFVALYLTAVVS